MKTIQVTEHQAKMLLALLADEHEASADLSEMEGDELDAASDHLCEIENLITQLEN
jgi:hypothetical protein